MNVLRGLERIVRMGIALPALVLAYLLVELVSTVGFLLYLGEQMLDVLGYDVDLFSEWVLGWSLGNLEEIVGWSKQTHF